MKMDTSLNVKALTVGLVLEFLGHHLVEILENCCLDDVTVDGSNTIHSVAGHNCKVGHANKPGQAQEIDGGGQRHKVGLVKTSPLLQSCALASLRVPTSVAQIKLISRHPKHTGDQQGRHTTKARKDPETIGASHSASALQKVRLRSSTTTLNSKLHHNLEP